MLKSLSIYTIASFLNAGIPFFLLPILTNVLLPSDLEKLFILQIIVQFLIPIVCLGNNHLVSVDYFKIDFEDFKSLFSTALIVPFIGLFLFTLIIYFFSPFLSNLFNIPPFWFYLTPLFAFLFFVPNLYLLMIRNMKKPIKFAIFQIFWTLSNLTLSILFVVYLSYGWEGRIMGVVISNIIFFLVGILLLFKLNLVVKSIKKQHFKNILFFGIPLIFHQLGGLIVNKSDAFFIDIMCAEGQLGIYMVGYQIGMIIMILQAALEKAWTPHLFSKLKNENFDKVKMVKVIYLIWVLLIFSAFVLSLIAPLLFKYYITNPVYKTSIKFVFWIALSYSFLGIYKTLTGFIFYLKKNKVLATLTLSNAIVNLILNYFLINIYGTIGAAYATLISMIGISLIAFILVSIYSPLPWLFFFKLKRNN